MKNNNDVDLFIFHDKFDRHFAEQLSSHLSLSGLKVLQHKANLSAVETDLGRMAELAKTCRRIAVVISEKSVRRPWVTDRLPELLSSPLAKNKNIIPVLLTDRNLPVFLQKHRHADFSKHYPTGIRDLVMATKPECVRSVALPLNKLSLDEKLNWLFNRFSISWIRQNNSKKTRQISKQTYDEQFQLISKAIEQRYAHLKKSENYSADAITSTIKSVRNVLREHLETQSIEPLYWLFCHEPNSNAEDDLYQGHKKFQQLLDLKTSQVNTLALELVLKKFKLMTQQDEAFIFANETIKHKTVNDFINYCITFLNFEII